MKASELLYKLDKAVQEQGDCEVMSLMETEEEGHDPLMTFDLQVLSEAGFISLVGKDGTRIPKVPHKEKEDRK